MVGLIIGLSILAVLVAIFAWGLYENTRLTVTPYTVTDERLPSSFENFKIAHISDLHNARFGREQARILAKIKEISPDAIVITGDIIDKRRGGYGHAATLTRELVKLAPTYYTTGNHEGKCRDFSTLLTLMKEAGVTVLRDTAHTLWNGKEKLVLAGLDDSIFHQKQGDEARRKQALSSFMQSGGYVVLLAHRPNNFAEYAEAGIPLALCGHAHGGQFRAFHRGLIAPGQGLFPRYTAGVYERGDTKMALSRGLGNSLVPIRLNNPPEILSITLTRGKE